MDVTLPMPELGDPEPLTDLLEHPFTPAMARAAGVERQVLERLVRSGRARRLLRGVYVGSGAPQSRELRAGALRLVVDPRAVVVEETAAWLHDVCPWVVTGRHPSTAEGEASYPPLRTTAASPRPGTHGQRLGGARQLAPRDIESVAGVRATTPLRTALDLGRVLAPPKALALLDAYLAAGHFSHTELLSELPRMGGHRGVAHLRLLAAQADGRAASAAESVLRLRWHDARLPTAVPGLTVAAGGRVVRMALGVERCQFGAVLHESVCAEELVALEGAGWRVVLLSGGRVLDGEAEIVMRHLEREFHQHLLGQLG